MPVTPLCSEQRTLAVRELELEGSSVKGNCENALLEKWDLTSFILTSDYLLSSDALQAVYTQVAFTPEPFPKQICSQSVCIFPFGPFWVHTALL